MSPTGTPDPVTGICTGCLRGVSGMAGGQSAVCAECGAIVRALAQALSREEFDAMGQEEREDSRMAPLARMHPAVLVERETRVGK